MGISRLTGVKQVLLTFNLLLICLGATAQQARVFGFVTDAITNENVELVTVFVQGTNRAVESDDKGYYLIAVDDLPNQILVFSRIGYKEFQLDLPSVSSGSDYQYDISMSPINSDVEVIVRESRVNEGTLIKESVEELKLIPSTTGNLESVLPAIALGTSGGTGGELSSQYNVRGGNYDENLVYVNDFEIYRPQLIRAGQQEGLSFPNINLMNSLSFSSGGFQAKYGDKLSSVLDIQYKRPDSLAGSFEASLLGASAHIEGSQKIGSNNFQKLRYLVGARYKTTNYLLNSLDITGEYQPDFADVQTYITYDFSRDWQLAFLGNFNTSIYNFQPVSGSTAFGFIDFALELNTAFLGGERDDFTTALGGISLTHVPDRKKNPYFIKFLSSVYGSREIERFDILGQYRLSVIDVGLGSDNQGEEVAVLGRGLQQDYVRNYLNTRVFNAELKGGYELQLLNTLSETKSHFFEWSVKFQQEMIDDRINEWERLDSSGYSLPNSDAAEVNLLNVLKTNNDLSSNRFSVYFQDTYSFLKPGSKEIKWSFGARASYWDLNEELIISPRTQFLFKPLNSDKQISYRLAAGYYVQYPFYRELRRLDGTINTDLKAQKSLHLVGGFTYDFDQGKRKTKYRFISEIFYKRLWDLVSYDIDNVRIRYSGENDAEGYVVGLDMRLNGEFVPGAESWINLGFLQAREQLNGVQHIRIEEGGENREEVNFVPRPSDQLVTFSMFFQDYFPRNENIKMHFNFHFGSGLPFGLPENNIEIRNPFRFKEYQRVDIGFSALIWDEKFAAKRPNNIFRFSKNFWISLEVFNLLQVANVASHTWIRDIFNQQYAVRNFLSSRRVNFRLRMEL